MGLDNGDATFFANKNAIVRDVHEYSVKLIYSSLRVHYVVVSWALLS
jgi:hypothetical protein